MPFAPVTLATAALPSSRLPWTVSPMWPTPTVLPTRSKIVCAIGSSWMKSRCTSSHADRYPGPEGPPATPLALLRQAALSGVHPAAHRRVQELDRAGRAAAVGRRGRVRAAGDLRGAVRIDRSAHVGIGRPADHETPLPSALSSMAAAIHSVACRTTDADPLGSRAPLRADAAPAAPRAGRHGARARHRSGTDDLLARGPRRGRDIPGGRSGLRGTGGIENGGRSA